MHKLLKGLSEQVIFHPVPPIIDAVRKDSLTFLTRRALDDLFRAVRKCEQQKLEGILIEAGCAAGGSAIVMAAAKDIARPLYLYDTFGMIPPPSVADGEDVHKRYEVIKKGEAEGIGGRPYYGYENDLLEKVRASFAHHGYPPDSNNVIFKKGLFQDTLTVSGPVAVAHLDGDWYESVMVCLQRIVPRLVPGGVLVIDDYFDWSGCRRAIDEYFSDKRSEFKFVKKSRLHIVRK